MNIEQNLIVFFDVMYTTKSYLCIVNEHKRLIIYLLTQ